MSTTPPDLDGFRAAQAVSAEEGKAFVAKQRAALAGAQSSLDQMVAGLGGRVVSRWWMTGQATVEITPNSVASVRALPGVTAVEPDRALE